MIAFAAVLFLAPQRAAAQSLSAQLTDKDIMVSEFNAVNVSDDFEVTVSRGTYGVRLTVDKELAPYVEVYVRSKVLYISYDEKAVPKEIRKIQNRVDYLEKEIGKLEKRQAAIEKVLAAPGEGDDVMELTREYLENKRSLDAFTEEWSVQMEKLDN